MSIRIHKLAEELGLENKELLALLKERKIIAPDVKSVSSTVDNISASALREEFASKRSAAPAHAEAPIAPRTDETPAGTDRAETPGAPKVVLPSGVRVKSVQDLEREAAAKVAAAKAAAAAAAAAVAPAPASAPAPAPVSAPRPVSAPPPTPRPVSAPPPVTRPPALPPIPRTPPAPSAHAPASVHSAPPTPPTPPAIPSVKPAPSIPPVHSAPPPVAAPMVHRPVSAPPPPPPVHSAPPKAPAMPPPLPPRHVPVAAPKPPPLPGAAPAVTMPQAQSAATPAAPGEIKVLHLKPPIVVRDFAVALGLKPFKLISELNQLVGFAAMNSTIEEPVAQKVAEKYGFMLEIKHRGDAAAQQAAKEKKEKKAPVEENEEKNLVTRPPVVCILGHVDHGKTSLLDAIRKANVAAGEAGGITQHIGAYQIEYNNRKITFLDTPGHAAFTKMRARGASATDVAILVVAADDGFMPQTEEALKIALAEKEQHAERFALIVAVNKMDVKGANLDQVKAQMQQRGIAPEDWGGETITVPVSAIKGTGINDLLEMILLQADVLELKANPKAEASGIIIESEIDFGRGPLATVIVQRGTLRVGDAIVCGPNYAKVRAMFDDKGANVKEAGPATPVRVIGWSGTPDSGTSFRVVKNAREAEKFAEEEQLRLKKEATTAAAAPKEVSVERLFANIAATQQKTLKVIIKTDVFGSSEAVRNVLEGIKSTKVSLEIVSIEVGLVTKNDVLMASAAGAVIIGFNTRLENGVTPLAKHHSVRIETYEIIYELGDKVREMMADLLEPDTKEIKTGAAEVRQVFPLAKGFVAGCLVTEGKIIRNATARLRRGREIVHEGKIATLKRFKDDANEVRAGLECGMKLDEFNGYQPGDVIESFDIQKVRASL
ncbi:translation initiation factor IF-2 [Opitutus sp. ER46]|uniref:translation initiation factor IF-2 n=1 Tax=Opitutus sp. ER46 TaxID=2161864 RepID=UPI000D315208|nr:translation initiation factor IF-2 [Opitutus sp. ER46]PTX91143.1 translation initiation factor IF-2 [Opitutus sp. ER46]